jgi:hypothetical protein
MRDECKPKETEKDDICPKCNCNPCECGDSEEKEDENK